MLQVLPPASVGPRQLAVDLIDTTLEATGSRCSSDPRTAAEMRVHADAVADMFCAYLGHLGAY